MKPTTEVLAKAIAQVKTSFTKEVIEFGFTPDAKTQFGISIVNHRGGKGALVDCYFNIKTGKLIKTKTVDTWTVETDLAAELAEWTW